MNMKSIIVTVPFKEGLHARPATDLVKICQTIKSDISLIKEDVTVNPKSILGIMSLGATFGSALTVEVDGADEDEAIDRLGMFFAG
jgi:phosphocarrier protein HPr